VSTARPVPADWDSCEASAETWAVDSVAGYPSVSATIEARYA